MDLYYMIESPPCRTVIMVGKQLGLEFNLKSINLALKEQLSPEFIKINPQHTVPTLVDGDLILWESRAIITYLANKHQTEESLKLYPVDPKQRAHVDRILQFDIGTLMKSISEYVRPLFFGDGNINEEAKVKVQDAIKILDYFLDGHKYIAGDQLTLADFAVLNSLSMLEIIDYDIALWKNVKQWYEQLKNELPYYDEVTRDAINNTKIYIQLKKQNK